MRERTHRNTAESTNARVKWWSLFQLGVLLGEGIFQVWWLKRFFEVCLFGCQVSLLLQLSLESELHQVLEGVDSKLT